MLIDAERARSNVRASLQLAYERTGYADLAVSTITLVELAHGVARSPTDAIRRLREQFLADVRSQIPVYAVDEAIAVTSGLLGGRLKSEGIALGLADLIIGVTALHFGHGVLTRNVRHFKMIPELDVVQL